LNDKDFNDKRGDKKYVHANYRYGVNCGSKIKYSRYRQILAAHGKQSSDTGYSFRETYSPYRHYGSKENQIWTDMKVKIGIQIEFIAMVITHTMINTQVE
jgi:hypothetical protein